MVGTGCLLTVSDVYLCTELFYHPYLVSMLFADLLSVHLVTFLFLFMSLFLAADACLS